MEEIVKQYAIDGYSWDDFYLDYDVSDLDYETRQLLYNLFYQYSDTDI